MANINLNVNYPNIFPLIRVIKYSPFKKPLDRSYSERHVIKFVSNITTTQISKRFVDLNRS